MAKTKEGYGSESKGNFSVAYKKRTGDQGFLKDAITGKKRTYETREHAEISAQSMRNWARIDYKNQGRKLTEYSVVESPSKTVGNNPMPTVGSSQPHGYGHSSGQRDGHLRLSGNPKSHRIGKR